MACLKINFVERIFDPYEFRRRGILTRKIDALSFSHSCARNLTHHIRNVPDDVLEKVKVNGGAVCVSFVPVFVKENIETDGNANVGDVADHFDYIRKKIGAEHLCIGGDYYGVSSLPDGLEDVGTVNFQLKSLELNVRF